VGNNNKAWTVLGVVSGWASLLGAIIAAWNSLSKDVAVVKTEVAGIRENVARHEQQIEKLRDARRAAADQAAEPAA